MPLHLVGGAAHQLLADLGRAGEADLAADRVFQELVGDLLGRADDEVGHARRQAGVDQALEDLDQAQRRLAGGPADDGAAGRQGRGDLARLQRDREVPRADGPDDADRMLERHVPLARHRVGDDLAVGALAFLGEPLEGVGRVQDLGLGLGQRLALLHGQGAGDGVAPLAHQVGGLLEDLGAVPGGELHPAGHGALGGLERPAGVFPAAIGHLGQHFLGGRVDDPQRAAVPRIAPLAVDVHALHGSGRSRHEIVLIHPRAGTRIRGRPYRFA